MQMYENGSVLDSPVQRLEVLPTNFLEYQIMMSRARGRDGTRATFHIFCEFFQKGFLENMWCESDWLVWYSFLYDILDNPIFMLPDDSEEFLEILESMFITNNSMAWLLFDLRYQAFLNIIEKIPVKTAMTLLMRWLDREKDLLPQESHFKIIKVMMSKWDMLTHDSDMSLNGIVRCLDRHLSEMTCGRGGWARHITTYWENQCKKR